MDRELDNAVGEERHDVGPFESTVFSRQSSIRNPFSRVVHCFMIIPLLLILGLALSSLGYFAVIDSKVSGVEAPPGGGHCILFADWNKDASNRAGDLDLGSGHVCVFVIFGEVAVAVLAALLIVWMIVKTSAGFYMASWLLVCEIPVLVIHMVFGFCVSFIISVGLAITCSQYGHYHQASGGCSNYTLPILERHPHSENTVRFYDYLHRSMVTSWLVVVGLAILLGIHVLLLVVFCFKRMRKSNHELIPVSDGESSSDGDSTDEAMVPIAELEKR